MHANALSRCDSAPGGMTPDAPNILATSFVKDTAGEGSIFPAAGGNSSDERVQAVYWRCIVLFFATARMSNPGLRLMFFTNAEPPALEGELLRPTLERLGVEIIIEPLRHRFTDGRSKSWGNVLYFLDVLDAVKFANPDQAIALADCDVIVLRPIDGLYARLADNDFLGYVVGLPPGDPINGLNRTELTAIAARFHGVEIPRPVMDFGGELLVTNGRAWQEHRHLFRRLYAQALEGEGLDGSISTEEHFFSIVYAGIADRVGRDEMILKRLWTSRQFNTVEPGDERFAMWHLPAEKRYGLRDLYSDFRRADLQPDWSEDELVARAQERCGIPAISLGKRVRDTTRQITQRLLKT